MEDLNNKNPIEEQKKEEDLELAKKIGRQSGKGLIIRATLALIIFITFIISFIFIINNFVHNTNNLTYLILVIIGGILFGL